MKDVKYALLIFVSLLCFTNVKALDNSYCQDKKYACEICAYSAGNPVAYFYISSDASGKVSYQKEYVVPDNTGTTINVKFNSIAATNFVNTSTNKLICPTMKYDVSSVGANRSMTYTFSFDKGNQKANNLDNLSMNNGKTLDGNNEYNNDKIECDYENGIHISSDGKFVDISADEDFDVTNGDVKAADFVQNGKLTCPNYYVTCNTRVRKECAVHLKSQGGQSQKTEGEQEKTGTEIEKENNPYANNKTLQEDGVPVKGCEMLGKDFYQFLQDTLDLIKIIGPILTMVLGMVDFLKASTSGEDDAKKKATKTFSKRLLATVLLFLIPALLQLVLSLINRGDTTCNLS